MSSIFPREKTLLLSVRYPFLLHSTGRKMQGAGFFPDSQGIPV